MIEAGRGALWAALAKTGTVHHAPVFLQLDVAGPNDVAAIDPRRSFPEV